MPDGRQLALRTPRQRLRRIFAPAAVAALLVGLPAPADAQEETLRELASAQGFRIGAAVAPGPLANEAAYRDTLNREFNSVTAENAMKWGEVEPQQGQFDWGEADQIVNSAAANGQQVHGHTLVWHSQLPGWVENGNWTRESLLDVMRDRITTMMTRYPNVPTWDVVNEAFNEDGTRRQSIFQQVIGDDYIAEAFRAARAADPDATLFINDYNVEGINAKSNGMYDLVSSLRQQGVPIDGVGIQGHLILGQVPSDLQQNIQRFADLGVDVFITELDIRIQLPADQNELNLQAQNYGQVMDACLAVDRCIGVTTWGFTDRYSWIPDFFDGQGAALPFDENYQPKPAYDAMLEALGGDGDGDGNGNGEADCQVTYSTHDWNTGFTARLTIANTGTAPIDGWTLRFSFPAGQQITHGWSANWSQGGGADVTATNMSWNALIAPNSSIDIGFNGSHTGSNPEPTSFSLNETECDVG